MRSKILKISLFCFYFVIGFGVYVFFAFGAHLMGPFQKTVVWDYGRIPYENVEFEDSRGTLVKGWYIKGVARKGNVIILHGGHRSRMYVAPRIEFLHQAGYGILLFDFQAHGETKGDFTTYGYNEAENSHAAVRYLRERFPEEKIAFIAPSMGGASLLVRGKTIDIADAYVFEAVYSRFSNMAGLFFEMQFGLSGKMLSPIYLYLFELYTDVDLEMMSPIEEVGKISSPVLVMGGEKDNLVPPEDVRAFYEGLGSEDKELWIIPKSEHYDLYLFVPDEYARRVLAFLGKTIDQTE